MTPRPSNIRLILVNSSLIVAAAGLLAYYIVQANALSALSYDLGQQSRELAQLRDQQHAIGARIAEQEHPDRIAEFARSAGMVVASDAQFVSINEPPLAGRYENE